MQVRGRGRLWRGPLGIATILLLLPGAVAANPLIVGVSPQLPDGPTEGFALGAATEVDVGGWRLSDGEGTFTVPAGTRLTPGVPSWFSNDPQAWARYGGGAAGLAVADSFTLANGGDQLTLLRPDGSVVDAVAWGDKSVPGMAGDLGYTSKGLLYTRHRDPATGDWLDTDHARDWQTPIEHRIGATRLDRPTFVVDRVVAFSSPDSSHATLTDLVGKASARLHLHVYELRSATLVDALVAAKARSPGLDLAVLVDGNPVGMTTPERHATTDALSRLQRAGATVVLAGNGRYDDWHQKVLVADDAVVVMSENWVDSGVPQDPSTGNRGWGVVLEGAAIAQWFAAWMSADRQAWDVAPFDAAVFDPTFEGWSRPVGPRTGEYGPIVPATAFQGPIRVTPVVAPDHNGDPRTDPIARLVLGAKQRLVVQQLDLALGARNDLGWRGDDPWYEAIKASATRGVPTSVVLAQPFAADDTGNEEALAALARHGAVGGLFDRPGISTLHNKGFVVDGTVVVGSMNGNHHSRSANREVDVVVESEALADHFAALAASDLDPPAPPRDFSVIADDLKHVPGPALVPIVILVGLVAWRRRWT